MVFNWDKSLGLFAFIIDTIVIAWIEINYVGQSWFIIV